jgi:hypothetical protein
MSMQVALQFIRRAREEESLQSRIQALGPAVDLAGLVEVGMEAAMAFTADELQAAFKHDWQMRWFHYSARNRYEESPPRSLVFRGVL